MGTEFPRVILHPIGSFKTTSDYHYQTLKSNVDLLKPIQLGLTFSDRNLNHHFVFQFNFREFDPQSDVYASEIDFEKNLEFGELLMSSGVVLNDAVQWIAFHSGYDFSYLLKIMTCKSLPESQEGFFDLIRTYFPRVYDIKHLIRFCNSLHGGLDKLAELLELERIEICHQEGSDSLLTACAFGKDGEIERLLVELAELHKGRRKLLELVNMKEN